MFQIDEDDDDGDSFAPTKPGGMFQPPNKGKAGMPAFLQDEDDDEEFVPKMRPPTLPSIGGKTLPGLALPQIPGSK